MNERIQGKRTSGSTRMQQAGMAVFVVAVVFTAIFIGYGITGTPLPKWMLVLSAIL